MMSFALLALIAACLAAGLALMALVSGLVPAIQRYRSHIQATAQDDLRAQFIDLPARRLLQIAVGLGLVLAALTAILLPWPVAVAAGLTGLALPRIGVYRIRERRRRAIIRQLPDALQTLASSLRAGTNIGRAMALVSRRQPAPLSQEFGLMLSRQRLGEELETVLGGFAERVPAEETALFRNAIMISHRVGGDLAHTLDTLSITLRERAQVEERITALTAMGRMQGRVMMVLPFGIGGMLYLQQPAMMARLFTEPLGWAVIVIVAVAMALAMVSIRRVVAIDI
ncbi:hypothetical protein BBH56_03360 [Spiribacter roseus]|uniref:type II secretion system F family protein n=1 Tax=Spiribacter roseus TaxID=1855875 RepID=UPI000F6FDFA5|nr:hypothetical protein BBH56_03360 [Spiribacter roseus]